MNSIEENLQQLEVVFEKGFPSDYMHLNPRLMNDAIKAVEQWHKIRLPEVLKPLYRWRNGQKDDTLPVFFFGGFFSLDKVFTLMKASNEAGYRLPEGFFPLWGELSPAAAFIGYDRDGYFNHHNGAMVEIDFDCYTVATLSPDMGSFIEMVVAIYDRALNDKKALQFNKKNTKTLRL